MHDDWINADQFHEHDVAREALFKRFVDHRVAAVFNDNRTTRKFLNIGQRFG